MPEERFARDATTSARPSVAVLDQDAYLPTENDLPPVGTDLLNVIANPDAPRRHGPAVVLHVHVRPDRAAQGQAATARPTKLAPWRRRSRRTCHKAVYALHDYYVGKRKLQYDDSGARMTIMKEWGYSLRWAGTAKWTDLPAHIELPVGDYIVDIEEHTLKLTVDRPITSATRITSVNDFFTDHSESDNWALSKTFNEKMEVTAIWKQT